MERTKVIIMGAAGRDFHNFNTFFRGNSAYEVVAFTATQIPDIDGRKYPAELAGELYPEGIMIYDESQLPELIRRHNADQVVFSYSDVPHEVVMHKAALVNACGADFLLMGGKRTMLESSKPVIAINAVRTGCGKSQTTRRVVNILREMGLRVVSVRHPMPYGNLAEQAVQRFASLADLKKHRCTIEEMEEYEPHIAMGSVIYSGVDYEAILREAEKEADIILWDGGNNDTSFFKADLIITVVDPHRPGHETSYYPGETNLRMADIVIINKIDTADNEDIESVRENIRRINPKARIVDAASPIFVEDPDSICGKRVLVIEDGPTLTHGEMEYGAGTVAAVKFGAKELVDPRPYTVGTISKTFEKYPDIGILLPAMGYGEQQMKDLEKTVAKTNCDAVIIGTPIDLRRVIRLDKPSVRVSYELQEIGKPDLKMLLESMLPRIGKKA
ncbi:MAG: cyclic 2,3-diphosphoglycerate synthase [Candidatus Marinimicrobia bacterium]|jgi:predicted GTPase|nr:cyclic 2,3-diphosphoglycerate synthase [Candidatus Neomarinimicrobiota bacterium]MDD5709005.1 cyclic 2,3-diphosphoglycerate synthase [Candidatus Neomarinimicrobiota bacterium]MDX9777665.1 cyclic 2,3-diphosphoglycerate synthase [bacterium]